MLENLTFWGIFWLDDKECFQLSNNTKYLDQKMKFHEFFRPGKCIFKFEAVNLLPLTERRAILSEKFIAKNKQSAGPLNNLLSSISAPSSYHGYHLRSGSCGSDAFKANTKDFPTLLHVNIDSE